MMRRYLAFAGMIYYPSGGWNDYVGDFETSKEARQAIDAYNVDDYYVWWHIIDSFTGKKVDIGEIFGERNNNG